MAVRNRINRCGFTALLVILICFLLILFCLPLISCEAVPQNDDKHEIECVKNTIVDEWGKVIAHVYVFELEGHRYAINYTEHYLIHLASCPCHNKENESSSFWETPSSSIFNW